MYNLIKKVFMKSDSEEVVMQQISVENSTGTASACVRDIGLSTFLS